jgi:capsular exopolysaccharide synthesis family protein
MPDDGRTACEGGPAMSRPWDALGRAEGRGLGGSRFPVLPPSMNGRRAPHIRWDFDGHARLEYERIGVWMKTATQGKLVRTLVVVGCRSGNGATTTAALMAATLASSKRVQVLLVDANLQRPSLDLVFGVQNAVGLTDVLSEAAVPDACIKPTGRENLSVLTTGAIPAHAGDVFERKALASFIERTVPAFDFVIFDGAPVLEFPAMCALAACTDGTLLVLHADQTSVEDARRARTELERAEARVIGAVLNRYEDYTPRVIRRLFFRA